MFMGARDVMLQREASKPVSLGATLLRFWEYFSRYWYVLLAVAALVVISTYLQVLVPELLGQAVNCYLAPATQQALNAQIQPGANASAQLGVGCWYAAVSPTWTTADYVAGLTGIVL